MTVGADLYQLSPKSVNNMGRN